MPHTHHRTWIEIQKKHAGFHHPSLRSEVDHEWVPNADVIEQPDRLVVRLELAGIEHASIQLVVARTALVVSGRRINPDGGAAAADIRFRQMEIEYGPFERVLPLPFPVQPRDAKARYKEGMLEIMLARASSATRMRQMVVDIKW